MSEESRAVSVSSPGRGPEPVVDADRFSAIFEFERDVDGRPVLVYLSVLDLRGL